MISTSPRSPRGGTAAHSMPRCPGTERAFMLRRVNPQASLYSAVFVGVRRQPAGRNPRAVTWRNAPDQAHSRPRSNCDRTCT